MQIFMYNSDDFDSLGAALRQRRMIAAMAVFFQVGASVCVCVPKDHHQSVWSQLQMSPNLKFE